MTRNRFAIGCHAAILAVGVALGMIAVADTAVSAKEPVPQLIQDNKLLRVIYQKDPQTAVNLVGEIERYLAAAKDRGAAKDGKVPELKFRDSDTSPAPAGDEDILERNKKAFEENPVLRNIYFHSPVASLRLLERFRDAAGKFKN